MPLAIRTTLTPAGPAAAIVLSDEQVASLGSTKVPPVRVTIGGHTERMRVGRMGGKNLIGFSKAMRAAFGVATGDEVDVVIELDEAPRTVEIPTELERALAGARGARKAFDALAFTHQREYTDWVASAKKPETRERRAAQAIERLLARP